MWQSHEVEDSAEMEGFTSKKKKIDESAMIKSTSSSSIRPWADLSEDILVSIYEKLDLRNRLKGSPLCCTSWYTASKHPSLWNKMCLPEFFDERGGVGTRCSPRELVEFVVNRSQGLLTSIAFLPSNSVQDLVLVAERCPKLKHFHLKLKELNWVIPSRAMFEGKKLICTAISKLKELESVEVDDEFIFNEVLETIVQNCPNFHKLSVINSTISSETAFLIIEYLPKLKTLDLKSADIHRKDLLVIFSGCLELEDVDICGCGKIWGGDEILKIGRGRFKKFEWEGEAENSCRQCEESPDYKGHYKWPCEHSHWDSLFGYIDGTMEMIKELHPDLFDYDEGEDEDEDEDIDWWI